MLITLVTGNMIGSGIFLLPSSLAAFGSISLLSWVFTSCGAILIALVFARMSVLVPRSGGPYAYADAGFGEFVGFQTAYNYWIALWVGNAAIAVAFVGYMRVFFPSLQNGKYGCLLAIAVVWALTLLNCVGVRRAGGFQLVTTVLKLLPLALICTVGWLYFKPQLISQHFNISGESNFMALSNAATITLWAFIGLESATVPAGSVENPSRNIPLATVIGTLVAALIYIISSTVIMGMIPAVVLQHSTSPFADAAMLICGRWGDWIIALGAAISCLGALNGWCLLQGHVAMAAADNKMFPAIFGKRNRFESPAAALIITSILISGLLLLTSSPNLIHQFDLIILLATLASLLPYFYTCMAQVIILKQRPILDGKAKIDIVIALLAAAYAFWAILGSGEQTVFYGTLLLLSSVPAYIWVKIMYKKKADDCLNTIKRY